MKSIIIFLLTLLNLVLGGVIPSDHSALVSRNASTTAIGGDVAIWKMNPSIDNANCSEVYASNIYLTWSNEEVDLSKSCADLWNFLGGQHGNVLVDLTFICQGSTPGGVGDNTDKLKVVIFMQGSRFADGNTKGLQYLNIGVQGTNFKTDTVIFSPAVLEVTANADNDGFSVAGMYCQA